MRHINIPVFIPHLGCPHTCVFCNQRTISGHKSFELDEAVRAIDAALSTVGADDEAEIAFFGGSFTGIERGLMLKLLEIADDYRARGLVGAIRCSTRPDYIDEEIIEILTRFRVKTVELGIQSMNDAVLRKCERGHSRADTERACALIKAAGITLVGQMMTGLPSSTPADDAFTARRIAELGASQARIYPTVVLRGTKLCEMLERGEYIPPTRNEAVERACAALREFTSRGVEVIRMGLCAADNLTSDDGEAVASTYDPAIGERVWNAFYLEKIRALIGKRELSGAYLTIECAAGQTSKLAGQRKCNKLALTDEYKVKSVKIIETDTISRYNIRVRAEMMHKNIFVSDVL